MNYFIYKVKNFKLHKQNLIDLIYKIPNNPLEDGKEKISHTDWNLDKTVDREYFKYFEKNILKNFSKNFIKILKTEKLLIDRLWFQVYRKNDYHGYHTHAKANFANIFYLKLPNKNVTTSFKMPLGQELKVDVEEGDILTFPAFYIHQSPINTNEEEKIIISFNSNSFYDGL